MTTTPLEPITGKTPSKRYQIIGFVLTGIWILGVLGYSWFARGEFGQMAPNEFGDFFAGAFAPLAFLWLVLGFFQQGDELRHSAEALWLQGRELQHSVEAQRDLVTATREQLAFDSALLASQRQELERGAQPVLQMQGGGSGPAGDNRFRRYGFRVFNHGRPCTAFSAFEGSTKVVETPLLDTGKWAEFSLDLLPASEQEIDIKLAYLDANLAPKSRIIRIIKIGQGFEFVDLTS